MMPERARLGTCVHSKRELDRNNSPIAKHLTQTLFLVRPDDRLGFQVDVEVRIDSVVAEIVLFQHGQLNISAPLLDSLWQQSRYYAKVSRVLTNLDFGVLDLKWVYTVIVLLHLIWRLVNAFLQHYVANERTGINTDDRSEEIGVGLLRLGRVAGFRLLFWGPSGTRYDERTFLRRSTGCEAASTRASVTDYARIANDAILEQSLQHLRVTRLDKVLVMFEDQLDFAIRLCAWTN
jgi:hypothetical protein